MKTSSSITSKIKVFAVASLLGTATLFQPPAVFAQKAGPAETEVTSSGPALMASIYELEPLKVRVHLANPVADKVDISIRDGNSQSVFRDSFKGTAYSRVLDLTTMAPGTYTIQAGNGSESISRTFSVQATQSRTVVAQTLEHQPGADLMAAIYEVEPMKVKVHVADPSGEKVNLVVRNGKNEVVLQKTATGEKVAQILDLSKLTDGAYTIQVSGKGGKASRTFDLATESSRSFVWEGSGGAVTASANTK